jgi:hypothetical protein
MAGVHEAPEVKVIVVLLAVRVTVLGHPEAQKV